MAVPLPVYPVPNEIVTPEWALRFGRRSTLPKIFTPISG